jgi:N-acyl-D-aspartate/D-glutamate deacylase
VFGNCGVGFAPVRPGASGYLINLMEGVEDIPGTVLSEGVKFNWESFPDYLDTLESMRRAVDVAAQLPHGALRFYVMGERGADHAEVPNEREIEEMARLPRRPARRCHGFHDFAHHQAQDAMDASHLARPGGRALGIAPASGVPAAA